eukprot:15432717-Alexandrium_andersonii.AAC.1
MQHRSTTASPTGSSHQLRHVTALTATPGSIASPAFALAQALRSISCCSCSCSCSTSREHHSRKSSFIGGHGMHAIGITRTE